MKNQTIFAWIALLILIGWIGGCAAPRPKPLEKMTEAEKTELIQTYLQKGDLYEQEGDPVEAAKQYKLALTVNPQDPEAKQRTARIETKLLVLAQRHYQQGLKFHRAGKYKQARLEFLRALRLWPDHAEAVKMLSPRPKMEAKNYVVHIVQPSESISKLAMIYYGDYHKYPVIAEFNELPDATRVEVGQQIKIPIIEGVPFLVKKQEIKTEEIELDRPYPTTEEEQLEERAPEEEPVDPAANYRANGIELFNRRSYREAVVEFEKVLNIEPRDAVALEYLNKSHFELGRALFASKNFPAARRELEESLRYKEDCPECRQYIQEIENKILDSYWDQGVKFFSEKKYREAVAEFEKVMNARPDDPDSREYLNKSHFQQGLVLLRKEKYLAAKQEFEASLRYDQDCQKCRDYAKKSEETYKELHYNKGIEHFSKEELVAAIKEWEKVQAIDPDYKRLQFNINKAKMLLKRLEEIKESR